MKILYTKVAPDVTLPRQAYNAVGLDLAAYLISETGRTQQVVVPPRCSKLISTGLRMMPPPGFFIAICSRSGLAAGTPPIFAANAPGIIDPDFTGIVQVILYNGGHDSVYIKHGDYVAQMILLPLAASPNFIEVMVLPETRRGETGFGSTDKEI
jgi:dUTP pyrophosphatase